MAADEKWYFTKEQLANTPSRKHGYDADRELSSRQQAANLIQDMGQKLQVTQLCINTAIVYMHRFYMFHSFTRFHRNSMAAAALFLAAKVEEQPRKLEYVIKVAQICLHRDHPPVDIRSEAYLEQAQELVVNENILLQTLGFDVAIDHPHTHVVRCCHLVRASKELAQTSYFMASNSLHLTTMCLQYKPTEVACFCIHLACKWSNWEIPQSTEGKPWFWYVDKSVTQELLEQLTDEFLVMFEKCPSRLKKKIMSLSSTQNSTILSAFGNDGDKKRNGEGSSGSAISFGSSDDMKKKQEFQRHHPDFKKHPNMPHHSRPDSHGMQSKSSCMFGPPQRTQPPVHSGSSGGSTNQSRSMPVKPNAGQDPALAKRDHLHHKMRRPEEKHPTRNHEPIPPPYKKYDKVSSGSLSDFPQNSLNNNVRAVGTSSYMLPPSHQQLQPQAQPQPTQAHHPQPQQPQPPQILHPVMDVKPEITPHTINKHQIHPHAPNSAPPKPKTPPAPPPPVKVERSIFSPEKSTPPMETMTRIKVPSPTVLPSLTPGSDTSRKRSISRESELAIYSKTEDVKPTPPPPPVVQVQEHIKTENLIKEEKPLDNKTYSPVETSLPVIEPLNSTPPQSTSAQEESHKEQKKKKKKHKEHKEHKDRHKDKHKHKHKNRDSVKADPIVITIPKEKLTLHQQQPEQILKLKIPKDRIAAASVPSPTGLKIKIPKDKIKESNKRDRSEDRNAGPPSKYHRPNGTTLQVNKTIDLMECSSNSDINENDTNSLNSSLSPLALNNLSSSFDDDLVHKTPPGMTEAVLELVKSFEAEKSKQTDKSESSNNNCTNTTPTNNNNRNNINNNRNKQNNNLVSSYNNQEIVADAYHFPNVNREKYNNRNYYRPEQMNYNKNNYRGRGRGRYIRNRGGYNMGPRPPHPNYPGNFVPPQMNIPPPTLGYNPIPLMHHPQMLPYFTSQVYVPNYPPPPPLPEEPPPPQPPPPPPPPD